MVRRICKTHNRELNGFYCKDHNKDLVNGEYNQEETPEEVFNRLLINNRWVIIGFNHPNNKKSKVYRQNISTESLLKSLEKGINDGCNLFVIRGFHE